MRRKTAIGGGLAGVVGLALAGNFLAVHPGTGGPTFVLPQATTPSSVAPATDTSEPTPGSSAGPATTTSGVRADVPGPRSSGPAGSGRSAPSARSGQLVDAYVTAYTWHDNDPPGPAIADPVVHTTAGGIGSWADPVTLAVADGRFAPGTRLYLPHVRRYFVVEDTCASCGARPLWIDMWIDGRNGSPADVTACAEQLTGNFRVELDPPAGRPVDTGVLFGPDGCYTR